MSSAKLQKYLENKNKKNNFTNKTFPEFRGDLLRYANEFYSENIIDFSETSLGGLFLDFASIVGDSLVYYAEQQFNELDYSNATDPEIITRHLQKANIKLPKATPASLEVDLRILVPYDANVSDTNNIIPNSELIPVIKQGTTFSSDSGIEFILLEDVDFSKNAKIEIAEQDNLGNIVRLLLTKKGICTSGKIAEESFDLPSDAGKFLKIDIINQEITNIVSVVDEDFNEYYEVDFLSQDVVYKKVKNSEDGEDYISIQPAPYRYVIEENYDTGITSLRFGNGDAYSVKDDSFANPDDLILPLQGKDYFKKLDMFPGDLLKSNTLGITPAGKTITVTYNYGGGLSHNVPQNSVSSIENLIIRYPYRKSSINTDQVTATVEVNNNERASGGDSPPSFEDLVKLIPIKEKSQNRIINSEDLLSRIMTMPTNFGRIHKVVSIKNKYFNNQNDIFIVCKDQEGYYTTATDALKINLSKYIDDFRAVGDRYNLLDAVIYNFGMQIKIKIKKGYSPNTVSFEIKNSIIEGMRFDLLNIGSPIDLSEIHKIILSNEGVSSLITPKENIVITKFSGNLSDEDNFLDYNINSFNARMLHKEGFLYPPRGGIFELKYPVSDIKIMIADF